MDLSPAAGQPAYTSLALVLIAFLGQIFAPAGLRHDFFTVYQKKEPTKRAQQMALRKKFSPLAAPLACCIHIIALSMGDRAVKSYFPFGSKIGFCMTSTE
jgi:hypothetical protein